MVDSDIRRFRWVLILALVAIASIAAYCLEFTVTGTGKSILNSLARVQAAIFAIVFSVVILGVRLSATRYSPRLASAFKSDPAYRNTVGVFAGSIGIDLLVLYLFNSLPAFLLTVLLFLSGGLAVGAVWVLYDFVDETLEKTTPEGILTQLDADLTPISIVRDAHASAEDPTNRDPFLVLLSVTRSTIEETDTVSASIGIDILEARVNELLKSTPSEEFAEGAAVQQSLADMFENRLPDLIEEALGHDMEQIAKEVIETVEEIGLVAVAEELDHVLEPLITGQTDVVGTIGYSDAEERLRMEVINCVQVLLREATDQGLWESAGHGARFIGWKLAVSITNRGPNADVNSRYSTRLLELYPTLLSNVVDAEIELTDSIMTEWMDLESSGPADRLVSSCYNSMCELSSAALRYELTNERSLLDWRQAAAGWAMAFQRIRETRLIEVPQLWLGTIFYLQYLESETPDHVLADFNGGSRVNVEPVFARTTIDRILDEDLDPTDRINHLPGRENPPDNPGFKFKTPPITDPERSFEEWLQIEREAYTVGHPE